MKIQTLRELAPHYHQWVDKLLGEFAGKATSVAKCGFTRLPQYFTPQTLTAEQFVVVETLPDFPFEELGLQIPPGMEGEFNGVTYRQTYFITPRGCKDESLHFHELVHVVQWQILGAELCPLIYALEAYGKDYRTNAMESMAYGIQELFNKGTQPFSVELAVSAGLGRYLPPILGRVIRGEL